MKKTKKKKIVKILSLVSALMIILCALAVPVSAIQTGGSFDFNVYNGDTTYTFMSMNSLKYITNTSSGKFYWKDIPVSSYYNVSKNNNFAGRGVALATTPHNEQVIYSDEVKQSILPPTLWDGDYGFDVNSLSPYYFDYVENGNVDMVHTFVSARTRSGGLLTPYQSIICEFDDIYMDSSMLLGTDSNGRLNYSMYAPLIVVYGGYQENVPYHITFTLDGIDSNSGAYLSKAFDLSASTYIDTVTASAELYAGALRPFDIISYNIKHNQEYALFKDSKYFAIRGLRIQCGNTITDFNNFESFVDGGAIGYDIRQPSLRPWNMLRYQSGDITSDKLDINYKLNNAVSRGLGANGASGGGGEGETVSGITRVGLFIADTLTGFFTFTIFPGFTIGGLFFTVVAIMLVFAFLKYYAGG